MGESSDLDCWMEPEPRCPWCGTVQGDAWEWGGDEDGEKACGTCEKPFTYIRHITVEWTTKKKEAQPLAPPGDTP